MAYGKKPMRGGMNMPNRSPRTGGNLRSRSMGGPRGAGNLASRMAQGGLQRANQRRPMGMNRGFSSPAPRNANQTFDLRGPRMRPKKPY